MKDLAVFGIGSPFGDDRIGWEVIASLEEEFSTLPDALKKRCLLQTCDRPGLQLINLLQQAKTVILVDAVNIPGTSMGECVCLDETGIVKWCQAGYSSHHWGLAEAVQMAKALHLLPERLLFYGFTIDNNIPFDFALSRLTADLLKKFAAIILSTIICVLEGEMNLQPLGTKWNLYDNDQDTIS